MIRAPGGALDQGGYDFMVFTHEFMHAMGLSHPHDDGGGSPIMNGVDDAFDDYGDHDLNQGTYTVMTYNNGFFTGTPGSGPDPDHLYGYEAGPMALDIAVLQSLYGANMTTATGDNVYLLPDANVAGTKWVAIWDSGGADEIRYDGGRDAVIDLRSATLLYEPGGGGWVSSADGIAGGYTIANGVVVEAATGGSGDDILTGNDAGNVLSGRGGADWIRGNGGEDTVLGGAGNDTLFGGAGADEVSGGSGDDLFLHDLRTDAFGDEVRGGDGADDHDVLDLRGHGPFRITRLKDDPQDEGAQRGTVEFLDGAGDVEGTLDFSGIETIQLCFAPGIALLTPSGEKPVEEIAAGDRVVTRDNGTQTVRWLGRDVVSAHAMRAGARHGGIGQPPDPAVGQPARTAVFGKRGSGRGQASGRPARDRADPAGGGGRADPRRVRPARDRAGRRLLERELPARPVVDRRYGPGGAGRDHRDVPRTGVASGGGVVPRGAARPAPGGGGAGSGLTDLRRGAAGGPGALPPRPPGVPQDILETKEPLRCCLKSPGAAVM
ncbi:hypothetical protein GCM10011360_01720 [Primorskyibacter flagellatus]|uniref:Serralysin n=1 Tax=Primorskyibacter flagellatus TaxID=1387277 RepID=A0A917E958_9RHOB|nr:hypothetical protein GCM10011360_01720 [Primorskyibacter flagellatus]